MLWLQMQPKCTVHKHIWAWTHVQITCGINNNTNIHTHRSYRMCSNMRSIHKPNMFNVSIVSVNDDQFTFGVFSEFHAAMSIVHHLSLHSIYLNFFIEFVVCERIVWRCSISSTNRRMFHHHHRCFVAPLFLLTQSPWCIDITNTNTYAMLVIQSM